MCISPITILNPYYKCHDVQRAKIPKRDSKGRLVFDSSGKQLFTYVNLTFDEANKFHNTLTSKIEVPCGKCAQCISNKQNFILQRVQMESLRSHLFLLTLTYNNRNLMHTNIGEYQIAYPYFRDWQNMCKNMRDDGYKFRYYVVGEYGSSEFTRRPHFHAIIAIDKTASPSDLNYESISLESKYGVAFLKYWRRNYGSKRVPIYDNLLDLKRSRDGRCTYDFHRIIPIPGHDNDTSFYVSKYLWKYNPSIQKLISKISLDDSLDDDQKHELIYKISPKARASKDFGSYKLPIVQEHISKCLNSNFNIAQYQDILTGKPSMMSRYYRDHLATYEWFKKRLSTSDCEEGMLKFNTDTRLDMRHDVSRKIQLENHKSSVQNLLSRKY